MSVDDRYSCVFNGEIYNFIELIERFDLIPNDCDGAIVPELWAKLGPEGLQHLRGMYALAIVDRATDQLILARDPMGIKPLYYRFVDDAFLFASEPRALASIDPQPDVDPDAIAAFLHLGAVPQEMSGFEGIIAVPPNTIVEIDAHRRIESKPLGSGVEEILAGQAPGRDDLGEAFRESVNIHLRSDVPTALLLSGGFDSAAIASVAHDLGYDLHCVTVGVIGDADESQTARRTATHYRHAHTVTTGSMLASALPTFFESMQRPTIDGLNTSIVSSAIHDLGIKVALSGLGGDEALGGYSHFRILRLLDRLKFVTQLPGTLARLSLRVGSVVSNRARSEKAERLLSGGPWTPWSLDLLQREVLGPVTTKRLTGIDPLTMRYTNPPAVADELSSYSGLVLAETLLYLQTTLLPDADAFSMSHSVEMRVPFVDTIVFDAAARAAAASMRAQNKLTLATALGDDYLVDLARRPKTGFTVPVEEWLSDGTLKPLTASLDEPDAPIWSHIDRGTGQRIAREATRWAERWAITVLNQWLTSLSSDNVFA
jgi:asparagine synthase (glutamine-hydrolysing)